MALVPLAVGQTLANAKVMQGAVKHELAVKGHLIACRNGRRHQKRYRFKSRSTWIVLASIVMNCNGSAVVLQLEFVVLDGDDDPCRAGLAAVPLLVSPPVAAGN